jgi:hypothetical protein
MANTFVLIQTQTVSSAVASVTFSSIPNTYTDLKLMMSVRYSGSGDTRIYGQFNSDGYNAVSKLLYGFGGGTVGSTGYSAGEVAFATSGSGETANTFGSGDLYILNYTSSNNKMINSDGANETNGTNNAMGWFSAKWTSSATINSIELKPASGNWVQYTSFSLYGIKKD